MNEHIMMMVEFLGDEGAEQALVESGSGNLNENLRLAQDAWVLEGIWKDYNPTEEGGLTGMGTKMALYAAYHQAVLNAAMVQMALEQGHLEREALDECAKMKQEEAAQLLVEAEEILTQNAKDVKRAGIQYI